MNKNSPVIRFKGFSNSWRSKILGNIVEITMGQSPKGEFYTNNPDDHILVQGNADMKNGKVVPRVWTTQVTKEAEPDDIILSVRAPVGDVGKTDYPVVLGRGVAGIKGNEFIYQSLLRMDYIEYWKKYTTGSTFESINSKDLKTAVIKLPESEEQDKIGYLFKHLDEKIEFSQHALTLLKKRKKAFLQKMFPKKGEKIPEIRFSGFDKEWSQMELGEAATFLNGKAYKQKELLDTGKYRVLRVGNFNTNDKWYYSDLELEENKYASTGDLLYLWATNFGPEIWTEEKIIYHYHIWKININDINIDKQYLYTWLLNDKERIKQTTNGSTMVHVTKGNMEKRKFQFPPNKKEQIKIGNFFKELDNSITLQEEKIELLKQMKKAFLQKMFV